MVASYNKPRVSGTPGSPPKYTPVVSWCESVFVGEQQYCYSNNHFHSMMGGLVAHSNRCHGNPHTIQGYSIAVLTSE